MERFAVRGTGVEAGRREVIDLRDDGSFRLNMEYFGYLDGLVPAEGAAFLALKRLDDARRDGDAWVLDGEKTWISNGGIADLYTVFARTGEAPGAKGLSARTVRALHSAAMRRFACDTKICAMRRDPAASSASRCGPSALLSTHSPTKRSIATSANRARST